MTARRPGLAADDGDLGAVGAAAGERRIDRPARALGRAPDDRQVAALEPAVGAMGGELLGETLMRAVGLGHHEQAGGVLVEAMHDARPLDAADAGQASPAMGDERVDQRAGGMAGARMHGQALGLVDDDQVGVLVDDGERHRLRLEVGGLGLRHVHGIGLARPDAPPELRARPRRPAAPGPRGSAPAAASGSGSGSRRARKRSSRSPASASATVRIRARRCRPSRSRSRCRIADPALAAIYVAPAMAGQGARSIGRGAPGGQPVRNA